MLKRLVSLSIIVVSILLCNQINIEVGGTGKEDNILSSKSFIDDMGNKISLDQPVESIVSLSATHTENLFYIGAGSKVIAVDAQSIFPYEAAMLRRYRLNKAMDLEQLIASKPDIVLIEPAQNISNTALVSALEVAGLKVVSLMPESIEGFGGYIRKLGILSGMEEGAESALQDFEKTMTSPNQFGQDIEPQGVFIESSERGYETVTDTSLEGQAILLAGGQLITPDLPWYIDESHRVMAGIDYIQGQDDAIDLYLSLQGDGNTGASLVSMKQKDSFKALEVMNNQKIYQFNSALVSRYTFRYVEGIKEVNRLMYGEEWHYEDQWTGNQVLTRAVFAELVYKTLVLPTYTLPRKDYYEIEQYHHTYGAFEDVSYRDEDFNSIETVVMKSYLLPVKEDQKEFFVRDGLITKEAIEHFLYIWQDLRDDPLAEALQKTEITLDQVNTVAELADLIAYFEERQVGE